MSVVDPLWTGLGLIAPLGARYQGDVTPPAVTGVSIDTRTLAAGDLFVAIKGDASDGHDYVKAAFAKGAVAAVVSEARAAELRGLGPLFIVHDTLKAMEGLGRAARARSKGRVIAVTGSVGKTSTKEALRVLLEGGGETHASVASYNNHWGVPLTLARFSASARFGVFEIGMNHPGEIAALVDMVRPHIALITTIAPAHLGPMGSIEAIADAKAEIFLGLEQGGVAIIPRDVAQFERLREAATKAGVAHVVSFGVHAEADARLVSCTPEGEGSQVVADVLGERIAFHLGAPGEHLATNALAALVAARAAGLSMATALTRAADIRPARGRGARETLHVGEGRFTLIDEAYNANPTSMRAALALLAQTEPGEGGRRIAAIGDMLELGDEAEALHEGLLDAVTGAKVDLLFAAGPLSKRLFEAAPEAIRGEWAAKAADIEAVVVGAIRPGDVVMIKGSNGSRMGPIVAALQRRYGEQASPAEG